MDKDESPLKILHILDHSLPVHSGYAFRSQALLMAQRRRGWDPIGVTSPKHYASSSDRWTECEQIGDLHYHRTRKVSNNALPLEAEVKIMFSLANRIDDIVRSQSPDLLHAHSPILNAIPALWVSRKSGIPMMYEMRALWEDAAVDHGTYAQHSWRYRLSKSLETWVCRKAAHVTVISDGLRTDLINRGTPSDRITVIPNGVDLENFRPCKPDVSHLERWNLGGKKIIGFIGSFFRYEGLDLLVEALAHLSKTRSDIGLMLVGEGEMEAELKAQIGRFHLEKLVAMTGSVPRKNIPEIYALMDILVYPRYAMRLTEIVTPLKPLEAMAMGKALVASNVGGHRELIRDGSTGLLFEPGSAPALVQALERLLNDTDLCEAMGTRGADWVRQERSWDQTTAGYSSVYSEVLKEYPGRLSKDGANLER